MIAILMATYNGQLYIEEQINSILTQSYTDWQLYIHDDGSSDNTVNVLKKICNNYSNIHLIDNHFDKHGATWNFINLLQIVEADYYMFCDQDDVWLREKVEKTFNKMRLIEEKDKPAVVCCDLKVVDSKLNEISPSFWDYMKLSPELLVQKRYAISCNLFTGCTMMINNCAKQIVFPVDSSAILHDYWVGLKVISHNGSIGVVSEQLILYRQHSNNVAGAHAVGKSINYYWSKLKNVSRVINDYKMKFRMANAIYGNTIGLFYFLYNRFCYLIKR